MIGTIRKSMQKRGAKIILWLTLFSLAGGSFVTFFKFSRKFRADSVGEVNDQDIGFMEFRRKFAETQQIVREIRKMYGPQADIVLQMWGYDKNPQDIVLEGLVAEKVLQSAADKLGVHISKDYIQSKLHDQYFVQEFLGNVVPLQAFVGGNLDVTALKYLLQRQGITESEFEEMVNEAMKRALLQRFIEVGAYIPQLALKETYERQYLKRKYDILALSYDEYLKKARTEKFSDVDIEAYFDRHKEEYRTPEKRSAKQWAFDSDGYGVLIGDKDVEAAYNKRKKSFIEVPEEVEVQRIVLPFTEKNKIEMRTKAQELLKEAKAKPETFEAIAQRAAGAKEKVGRIMIKRGEKAPALEQAAFSLQPNEISAVIETPQGFEIVKLLRHVDPVYKPFDKVKNDLIKSLKQEKFSAEFATAAQRVISQAYDMPDILTKFIAEKKGHASVIENQVEAETKTSEKLFGLQKVGDRAFYMADGKGFIVELTQITPSALPPLASVKEKVVKDRYENNAREALKTDLASTAKKLSAGSETLDAAAKALKGSLDHTDWIDPKDRSTLKKLQEKHIPTEQLLQLTKPKAVATEMTPTHGYVIVLKEREPLNEQAFKEKKASILAQLRHQEANPRISSFAQELKSRAKISINQDFLRAASRA